MFNKVAWTCNQYEKLSLQLKFKIWSDFTLTTNIALIKKPWRDARGGKRREREGTVVQAGQGVWTRKRIHIYPIGDKI